MDNFGSQNHEPKILGLTPFEGEGAVASVTLAYGPVAIRAKLRKSSQGNLFLSLPSRKGKDEKWWDHAYFLDRRTYAQFEKLALEHYHARSAQQAA